MQRRTQVAVIGDSTAKAENYKIAEEIGRMLAKLGLIVVTGGKLGIMEAVSKGVAEEDGIAIGILPSDSMNDGNKYCTAVIPTGIGYSRNFLTALACDILIAVGGKSGTLSEIIFGWIFKKPILALKGHGGWSDKVANTRIDDRNKDAIFEFETVEQLREKIIEICKENNFRIMNYEL